MRPGPASLHELQVPAVLKNGCREQITERHGTGPTKPDESNKENTMPRITRFRKMAAASLLSAVAVISIACSSSGGDPAATSAANSPQPTATAITSSSGGATSVPDRVVPTPPALDLPVSNPLSGLSSIDLVKAQEQVLNDLFNNTIESVVKIETVTGSGRGEGSGWIWDVDGYIVTNYHVVDGATTISISFFDGREYEGVVVGFNSEADLAVVKIELEDGDTVQPALLGNSSDLRVGQSAVALGNPFGQDFSMTNGIVSAVGRLLPSGFQRFSIPSVIQTDAAINPGNSGGPLLDIDGRVIGINTQIRSESGSSSGVGFAVPVDLVKRVVPNLIENGEHNYSFIGITGTELTNALRDGLNVANTQQGAYITEISSGTPAQAAGLREDSGSLINNEFDGDLIVGVDGQDVKSMDDLIAYLALNTSPGDDIVLTVLRAGQEELVVVTLTERP